MLSNLKDNIHPNDKRISFNSKEHYYMVDGNKLANRPWAS